MSGFRTTMLLAALTALFMGLGYTLGGSGGAVIALLVAAGMNLFTYWNADRIVLSMHGAREVDTASAPEFVAIVRQLADQPDELRRLGLGDLACAIHRQDDLVGVPIGEQVHAGRDNQRDHSATGAAKRPAERHEQRGQRREQHRRPQQGVHHVLLNGGDVGCPGPVVN